MLDGCSFSQFNNENCEKDRLKQIKFKNPNKLLVGHLNVNSYRNKMDYLQHFVDGNIDIFLLSETKLGFPFPNNAQFYIKGYSQPYRLDGSKNGGGLLLYVRADIPSKKLNTNLPSAIESFFIEIDLRKVKWLRCCCYNPQNRAIKHHLACITRELDSKKYDNLIVLGDFHL